MTTRRTVYEKRFFLNYESRGCRAIFFEDMEVHMRPFLEIWQDVRGDEIVFDVVTHNHVIPVLENPPGVVYALIVRKRNGRLQKRAFPAVMVRRYQLWNAHVLKKEYAASALL